MPRVKRGVIRSSINEHMKKVDFMGEESRFVKEVSILEKRIEKAGASAEQLYDLKSDLSGDMSQVFKKLRNGTDLTPKQAATYTYWKALKDMIDTVSVKVKKINTLQNQAHILSESLVPMINKGGIQIPFLNTKVGGSQIQSGRDLLGRALMQKSW